ncbi:hypothetical protein [Streptomyces sp. NPDC015125]|uniref:hypothetical protein n=1 Tax=Streptomyces sp. NPDC015125 TaxID=3364938 RepID=UPI0036FB6B3B
MLKDLHIPKQPLRYYPRLDDIRHLYCAPGRRVPWLVCDMDDGVVRVEPSRAEAAAWCRTHCGEDRVRFEHGKGSTAYEYFFGPRGDETSFFILKADHAHQHGFNPQQRPLHPFSDDPHHKVDRPRSRQEEEAQ